jgi:small-conductance mechanosensitive channel
MTFRRTAVVVVLLLALAGLAAVVVTRWLNSAPSGETTKAATNPGGVDEQPLKTAQRLAALATTPEEQELAQAALRVADHEVDLSYTAALRQATLHPGPLSPTAKTLVARINVIQDEINAYNREIARLKEQIAKADAAHKSDLEEQLQLQQAMLEVEQEDLDANQQELIRAGGDPKTKIQQLMDQHAAGDQTRAKSAPATASSNSPPSKSPTLLAQWQAWWQLAAEEQELSNARQEASDRVKALSAERQKLLEQQQGKQASAATPDQSGADTAVTWQDTASIFKQVAAEQRDLAELDKRNEDLKQLDNIYSRWIAVVATNKRAHLLRVIEGAGWIVFLLAMVVLADPLLHLLLPKLGLQGRRRYTVRIVARFVLQAIGLALILLVVMGLPTQLGTVLALLGAGLTVALKDYIVAFFGWFTLMGSNGIRPGDWVEINGVGGEVLEVGLLHTVLLETGNWSDAGHPTGRKVSFVNSFAIEGHYFNFSTAGQWLWDEIEVPIPAGSDPYPIAEAIQKDVLEETSSNMELAEKEWERVVPSPIAKDFSAAPAVSVRPTTLGVNIVLRYITRAHERHEMRSRLFYRIVEQLRRRNIFQSPVVKETPEPAAEPAGS